MRGAGRGLYAFPLQRNTRICFFLLRALSGHPVQNKFFALIIKIILTTPSSNNFSYQLIFSYISDIFGNTFKKLFEKGQILKIFSGLATSKLKKINKNLMIGYAYIRESFDTTFDMGYGPVKSPIS